MINKYSVNARGLFTLLDLLKTMRNREVEIFKRLYQQRADNFENCLELLGSLNLIHVVKGKLKVSPKIIKTIESFQTENNIKEFLLSNIINSISLTEVYEYLQKFSLLNNRLVFTPKISENILYSDIRNLLIELDFIFYDSSDKLYEISERYVSHFLNTLQKKSISPQTLKIVLEKKEEIGSLAELEICSYEKTRLSAFGELPNKIELIAKINVNAGYDIKSYTVDERNNIEERYIEVKAVSLLDRQFYFSRNEYLTSKLLGTKYYLYLLPVIGKNKFDFDNLEIIQDPCKKVFDNDEWDIICEDYLIKKGLRIEHS